MGRVAYGCIHESWRQLNLVGGNIGVLIPPVATENLAAGDKPRQLACFGHVNSSIYSRRNRHRWRPEVGGDVVITGSPEATGSGQMLDLYLPTARPGGWKSGLVTSAVAGTSTTSLTRHYDGDCFLLDGE